AGVAEAPGRRPGSSRFPYPTLFRSNAQAQRLAASTKNRAEHAFVVDWITERLNPVCARLTVPPRAQLVSTRDVWHLGTPIHGVRSEEHTSELQSRENLVCRLPLEKK